MPKFTRPDVTVLPLKAHYQRYMDFLAFDAERQKVMGTAFRNEIQVCLRHHKDPIMPGGSLKMIDTKVAKTPTGRERGTYYAVDFGGSNLRIVRVVLDGRGSCETRQRSRNIASIPSSDGVAPLPKGLLDPRATATMLFDAIADEVQRMMRECGDLTPEEIDVIDKSHLEPALAPTPAHASPMPPPSGTNSTTSEPKVVDLGAPPSRMSLTSVLKPRFAVGFTFSFPMDQIKINQGICICWTKGFETGRATEDPVEGSDVCNLLDAAFQRRLVPAWTAAALNDTTGTFLSCAYLATKHVPGRKALPPVRIGLIMGTGMNAAYLDPQAVTRWGYDGTIINTEMGGYNKGLPATMLDYEVDLASVNPGEQLNEKLASGMYLPELCRWTILKCFRDRAPKLAWVHWSLTTAACAAVAYDKSPDLTDVKDVMTDLLDWNVKDLEERGYLRDLFRSVFRRSAGVMAISAASLAHVTGCLQRAVGGLTVGVDGTLFVKNPEYQKDAREILHEFLGHSLASLIHFEIASDGSGMGAAILAATEVAKGEKPTWDILSEPSSASSTSSKLGP